MDWVFISEAMVPANGDQEVIIRVGAGSVRMGMQCLAVKRGDDFLEIENGSPPVLRVALIPVTGTITSVNAYFREVPDLPRGWTGKLVITGVTCQFREWDHLFLAPSRI